MAVDLFNRRICLQDLHQLRDCAVYRLEVLCDRDPSGALGAVQYVRHAPLEGGKVVGNNSRFTYPPLAGLGRSGRVSSRDRNLAVLGSGTLRDRGAWCGVVGQ